LIVRCTNDDGDFEELDPVSETYRSLNEVYAFLNEVLFDGELPAVPREAARNLPLTGKYWNLPLTGKL
jgi:hypothetical protein